MGSFKVVGGTPEAPEQALTRLVDGTVKQVSPLTGRVVWTIPGRSHRPFPSSGRQPQPIEPTVPEDYCAFCAGRMGQTPPERSRLVLRRADGSPADSPGGQEPGPGAASRSEDQPWSILPALPFEQLDRSAAAFRRIPNLFPILPVDYWQANHGVGVPGRDHARAVAYLATPGGRDHVLRVMRARARAAGQEPVDDEALLAAANVLFTGFHDLIVAERHYVQGATHDDELAFSGDLSDLAHHAYIAFTIEAVRDLAGANPHVRHVAVFQNWLRPAGASFDHLHKQVAAIDEHGPRVSHEIDLVRQAPDLYNARVVAPAAASGLVIAANDHAVAIAGVGHRFPTMEIYSTSAAAEPWAHGEDEVRGMSEVLRACHAATGRQVPTNEEWHYRPVGVRSAIPWRIEVKWRISTLAGFEGVTRIHVNTIDPHTLRDRVVTAMRGLREAGRIPDMLIGQECPPELTVLRVGRG